jgi:hypothetical protein
MSSRPELRLDWCSHDAARYAVEKWHYSQAMPKSKLAKIGIWEDGAFIGSIIYGVGATSDLVKRYGLKPHQGAELIRVAMTSHRVKVSRCLAISLRMVKRAFPGLRLIVSFADPEHGHAGGIYKASNWLYGGMTVPALEYLYRGKRWQGRSFRHKYGGMEKHPLVKQVMGSSKHRYLMPLDAEMRAAILPLAKPYPKRAGSAASGTSGIQSERDGATPIPALPPS